MTRTQTQAPRPPPSDTPPDISLDFVPPRSNPDRSDSSSDRSSSAHPLSIQTHHDTSRADSAEDLEGDCRDQIELHLRHRLCQLETNLEERMDFRNCELGKVVEAQNAQHYHMVENSQVLQQEL